MLIWPRNVDDDGLALADRQVQTAALHLIHQVLQLLRWGAAGGGLELRFLWLKNVPVLDLASPALQHSEIRLCNTLWRAEPLLG
jgi:hypothetical protein